MRLRLLMLAVPLALSSACGETKPPPPSGGLDASAPPASDADLAGPADAAPVAADAQLADTPDAAPEAPDAGTPSSADASSPDAYIHEVRAGVYQLDGVDPALPDNDLDAFAQLVGDSPLIGLGEAVHTSGGYYAAKNRLIRYLVEHQGFRGLAFETPRTDAENLTDHYVQTCSGTATEAARGISPVFADVNTAALLEWLCQWNAAHPDDRVYVWGFDMQQPDKDAAILEGFLGQAAAGDAAALMAATATCSRTYDTQMSEANWTACTPGLDALGAYLGDHRAALEAATGAESFLRAHMAQVSWRAWQDEVYFGVSDVGYSYQVRDVAMAWLFETWLDFRFPGVKTAIWAHNYHLTARHQEMDLDVPSSVPTFGSEVFAHRGEAYAAFALTSYQTGINWPGVGTGYQPLPGDGSIELLLHQKVGKPYLLLDSSSSWSGPASTYGLGGAPMVIARQFRGVFFLEDSPGMDALFW